MKELKGAKKEYLNGTYYSPEGFPNYRNCSTQVKKRYPFKLIIANNSKVCSVQENTKASTLQALHSTLCFNLAGTDTQFIVQFN